MSIKKQVAQELDNLSETELKHVAEYLAFLKFQARLKPILKLNETQLAGLYAKFVDDDRELAEEGISDYTEGLKKEDTQ